MRISSHFIFLALPSSFLPGAARSQVEAPLIPRKAIFADADKEQVQLSPDGQWIGYRAPDGGTMNVWVAPVGEPSKAGAATEQRDEPVLDYRWTYFPGQLLYKASAQKGTHVFVLDLEGREPRDITPAEGVVAHVEKLSPNHAEEALLRVKEPDHPNVDYRRVNLLTGASEVVFKNDQGFERVLFDDDWRPRVAMHRKPDLGYELMKPDDAGAWTPFASFRFGVEADASQPITLDKAGKTLYLTDNSGRDTAALKAIDLESGEESLLVEDPVADVAPALLLHPRTGRVQTAVSYYGRLRRHFLDPSVIPDFEHLRTVHRGDIGVPALSGSISARPTRSRACSRRCG